MRPVSPEKVLILGAGASYATHDIPIANEALSAWKSKIRREHKLLGLALKTWIGSSWPTENLEIAWTRIDNAWKERSSRGASPSTRDLTGPERKQVLRLARETAAGEPHYPNYYRTQLQCFTSWSYEQFLSVAAGWELLRLLQREMTASRRVCRTPYEQLFQRLGPTTVISFNYDTLAERCFPSGSWGYPGLSKRWYRIRVLKPHGSVNWTRRNVGQPGDSVRGVDDPPISPADMGYTKKDGLVQPMLIGLRTKIEHTTEEISPKIRRMFKHLLQSCEEAMQDASQVWIVGYSFPDADISFREVVGKAIARRCRRALQAPDVRVVSKGLPEPLLLKIADALNLPKGHQIPYCFCGLKAWEAHHFCNVWSVR